MNSRSDPPSLIVAWGALMRSEADGRPHQVYHCLDGLRGIAALLIVLRHTKQLFYGDTFQQSYLAVDLFFVLSGFVIANAYEQPLRSQLTAGNFMSLRVIRLYPLYFIGIALALVSNITDGANVISLIWHGILSLAFLPNPNRDLILAFPINVPAWSLFFELLINIFYVYMLYIITGWRLAATLLASFIALLAYVWFGEQHNLDIGWAVRTLPGGFARVVFSFYVGVMIYRCRVGVNLWAAPPLFQNISSWTLVLILGFVLVANPASTNVPLYDIITVAILFPLIVFFGVKLSPTGLSAAIFKFFGATSYAIYILHEPLGKLFAKSYTWVSGHPIETVAPAAGFIFIPFLFMISWLLDRLYDGPVRASARRLLRNYSQARAIKAVTSSAN